MRFKLVGAAGKASLEDVTFHMGTGHAGKRAGVRDDEEFLALLKGGEAVVNREAAGAGRNRTFIDIINKTKKPIEDLFSIGGSEGGERDGGAITLPSVPPKAKVFGGGGLLDPFSPGVTIEVKDKTIEKFGRQAESDLLRRALDPSLITVNALGRLQRTGALGDGEGGLSPFDNMSQLFERQTRELKAEASKTNQHLQEQKTEAKRARRDARISPST